MIIEREEAIDFLECRRAYYASLSTDTNPDVKATKVCGYTLAESANACLMAIKALEQEPKTRYCKDCKHWKDSDGIYRRDIHAESKCPMNCIEVYEGTGYCFLFESKMESEG